MMRFAFQKGSSVAARQRLDGSEERDKGGESVWKREKKGSGRGGVVATGRMILNP